ncbi:MAG: Trm112 family protein [Proteobacteria bacterium]|nr:Trm112 family protein [Pseudomonadota bacterium]
MLEVLVCPITGGALEYDAAKGQLISRKARRVFPIRGGIPIMLVDESLALDD